MTLSQQLYDNQPRCKTCGGDPNVHDAMCEGVAMTEERQPDEVRARVLEFWKEWVPKDSNEPLIDFGTALIQSIQAERDRQYEQNAAQIVKIAELEQQLAEARAQGMREAVASGHLRHHDGCDIEYCVHNYNVRNFPFHRNCERRKCNCGYVEIERDTQKAPDVASRVASPSLSIRKILHADALRAFVLGLLPKPVLLGNYEQEFCRVSEIRANLDKALEKP